MLLSIQDLHVSCNDKPILNGLSLDLPEGEVHAIMGPNGSGKSTLSNVLAGNPHYQVTSGEILYRGESLLSLTPEARAHQGIFLAFQYPQAIPGVLNMYLLKAALNAKRKAMGLPPLDAHECLSVIRAKAQLLQYPDSFLTRPINDGFSGGEKKRNEMLQMLLLEPSLAILDETDSGLDIDALKIVSEAINHMRDGKRSFLLITHYPRLLEHVRPDKVHILKNGRITQTGDFSLALSLEQSGYV